MRTENVLEKKIVHFLNHCYNNPACPSWPNRQVGFRTATELRKKQNLLLVVSVLHALSKKCTEKLRGLIFQPFVLMMMFSLPLNWDTSNCHQSKGRTPRRKLFHFLHRACTKHPLKISSS